VRVASLLALTGLACVQARAAPEEAAPEQAAPAATEPSTARAAPGPGFTLATSHEGRPIRAVTHGRGPRRVLWVGGIHGDEREGALATEALASAFLQEPGAAERVSLTIVEDLNPDGTARRRRTNARGVDLNRNFPAAGFRAGRQGGAEPLSEHESRALFELVCGWRPELVLVAHSWRSAQFVNYDGPAREAAERFAQLSGFELRESRSLGATPGSFGSWAEERGLAVLTLEYRRGSEPEATWKATREAILAVVLEGVRAEPELEAGLRPGPE